MAPPWRQVHKASCSTKATCPAQEKGGSSCANRMVLDAQTARIRALRKTLRQRGHACGQEGEAGSWCLVALSVSDI